MALPFFTYVCVILIRKQHPFQCLWETARSPFTYQFVVAVRNGLQKTVLRNSLSEDSTQAFSPLLLRMQQRSLSLPCFVSAVLCISGHTVPDASAVSFLTFRVGVLSLSSLRVFRGLPAASPRGLH
nr:MAG TPA: hypothetical protein [Caudoviricetes sp.]